MNNNLNAMFGNIDIYLFDQLLKGRYDDCHKVIDIGCGGGRNILYFLKNGYDVYGIDPDKNAIETVQQLASQIAPQLPLSNFVVATAEELPFANETFDLAICSAILHFAKNDAHFEKMLRSVWGALKPGGYFFARLASNIGLEERVISKGNGRYLLPDGTVRYLVNEAVLQNFTKLLNGELHEPIKTTIVSNLRCMSTWCMKKQ